MRKQFITSVIVPGIALISSHTVCANPSAIPKRAWTIEDIVTIPEVSSLALAQDEKSVAYLLRVANPEKDRTEYEMHVVTLADRVDRVIARSRWLASPRAIPGESAWSVLGDFGRGVQLYKVNAGQPVVPLVVNEDTVLVGNADGAEFGFNMTEPTPFGVASYDWSPDGHRLLYSVLSTRRGKPPILLNDEIARKALYRRPVPDVIVDFLVREGQQPPLRIASAPGTDLTARWFGAMPHWTDDALEYGLQGESSTETRRYRWSFTSRRSEPAQSSTTTSSYGIAVGPHDGLLAIDRINGERRLRERMADGAMIDYGKSAVLLGDPRAPGSWRAPDGSFALAAVRILDAPRYGVLRLDADGRQTLFEGKGSLRNCTFGADLKHGFCIEEGISTPPRLVSISAADGRTETINALAPRYEEIAPLAMEPRAWINQKGYRSNGIVIYPRGFRKHGKYPAVFVTHGSDADQRFGAREMQWSYPVQVLAERGYVVVLLNAPSVPQSHKLEQAVVTAGSCDGKMKPDELQNLLWLNTVAGFEAAIASLGNEGVIDTKRVGIAGYSAGSQVVNVAITQTTMFAAASSGDGGVLEPALYRSRLCFYDAIFGGPPSDPASEPNYRALTPSYRADLMRTPLLQQLAEPREGEIDFRLALLKLGAPVESSLYPGESTASDETHVFHIPSNDRAALQENLEWFDFWLRGLDPSPGPDGRRRERWQALREASTRRANAPAVSPPSSARPTSVPQEARAGAEGKRVAK